MVAIQISISTGDSIVLFGPAGQLCEQLRNAADAIEAIRETPYLAPTA